MPVLNQQTQETELHAVRTPWRAAGAIMRSMRGLTVVRLTASDRFPRFSPDDSRGRRKLARTGHRTRGRVAEVDACLARCSAGSCNLQRLLVSSNAARTTAITQR